MLNRMTPFADEVRTARAAQRTWAALPMRERLKFLTALRHHLVESARALTDAVSADVNRPAGEVLATDIVPTAAAAKYVAQRAARILAPRRVRGRPLWLWGVRDEVHRRPHGVVGLIGTWNYPIFLNAVPILHALAAGNAVLWKPSERAPRTAAVVATLFDLPPGVLQLLPGDRDNGPKLAEADIDFLHFTGSEPVGRKLAARLGERLIPSALELSGCDAMYVLLDGDPVMAARAAHYGATLNAGRTCMATRRAFVARPLYEAFVAELRTRPGLTLHLNPPPDSPACVEASFEPRLSVLPFDALDDAFRMAAHSPFALTAAFFTNDIAQVNRLAPQLAVGSVIVNDVIVPTAHPGTPFGGHGASGWNVTQGDEGLLAMTVPQTISVRTSRFRPHLSLPPSEALGLGLLRASHAATWRERLAGLRQLVRAGRETEADA